MPFFSFSVEKQQQFSKYTFVVTKVSWCFLERSVALHLISNWRMLPMTVTKRWSNSLQSIGLWLAFIFSVFALLLFCLFLFLCLVALWFCRTLLLSYASDCQCYIFISMQFLNSYWWAHIHTKVLPECISERTLFGNTNLMTFQRHITPFQQWSIVPSTCRLNSNSYLLQREGISLLANDSWRMAKTTSGASCAYFLQSVFRCMFRVWWLYAHFIMHVFFCANELARSSSWKLPQCCEVSEFKSRCRLRFFFLLRFDPNIFKRASCISLWKSI